MNIAQWAPVLMASSIKGPLGFELKLIMKSNVKLDTKTLFPLTLQNISGKGRKCLFKYNLQFGCRNTHVILDYVQGFNGIKFLH